MSQNAYFPGTPELEATPQGLARAGDKLHFLISGTTAFGRSWTRGQEHTLTAADIGSSINRHNESFIDRELSKGADAKLGKGPWPTDLDRLLPGDPLHAEARELARREAHARPPSERAAALQEVRRRFGESAPTSRTVWNIPDGAPSDPAAAAQDARLRERAVREARP